MTHSPKPQDTEASMNRPVTTRRELLVAATTLLAASASGSPVQAGVGAEGYFLVFDRPNNAPEDLDRVFFIPSAWLELFEVTDVYKARYPSNWKEALKGIRNSTSTPKKQKFHVLYADTTDPGIEIPFPGLTVVPPLPAGANQTYLAAMISPPP